MEKIKLMFIIPSMRGGGAERVIANLVKFISRDKFKITLMLIKKEGPYLDLLPKDIDIIDLDANRVRCAVIKMIKNINCYKPDIILSTLNHLNLVLLAVKRFLINNPKIVVRHTISPLISMKNLNFFKRIIKIKMFSMFYNRADIVLAQCKEMQEELVDIFKISDEKTKYIYNPVDLKSIRNLMQVNDNPYNSDKINLLAVGRLTYQKGFENIIKAINLVRESYPLIHLTILGEGSYKENLISIIQDLEIEDYITFKQFNNNPFKFYYHSDIYILSSRYEGFPNTLLEAMTCKTKVISTNCKNGPQEILGNNEFGKLVKIDDYKNLAKAIIEYYESENLTSNRAENFDIYKIVKEYERLILSLK